jgi:DNA-binding NtrC family response regulator
MHQLLILDNNERDVERYCLVAQRLGLEPIPCHDAEAALALLEKRDADVWAAVILWEFGGAFSGPQFIAQLKARGYNVPVLAVSASFDMRVAARARQLGAGDVIMKPLDVKAIEDVLQRLLGEGDADTLIYRELRKRLIGDSEAFLAALKRLARVIPSHESNVLLIGESGTGKELLARATHELGPTAGGPWVTVNVAAIPKLLLESALFGHESGAFTGATSRHMGYLEEACGGTLFLDEIGDLEWDLQAKILRAVEERRYRRVGGRADIEFSARLVCATNSNLAVESRQGRFRSDLYFRIAEYEVRIPPLRERGDDVILLAKRLVRQHAKGDGRTLDRETIAILKTYPFPGNVRELQSIIDSALLDSSGATVRPLDLPLEVMTDNIDTGPSRGSDQKPLWPEDLFGRPHADAVLALERLFNREFLPKCFKAAQGKVVPAARRAGMDPKTFRRKWKECGLGTLGASKGEGS